MRIRLLKIPFVYFFVVLYFPSVIALIYQHRYTEQYNEYAFGIASILVGFGFLFIFVLLLLSFKTYNFNIGWRLSDKIIILFSTAFFLSALFLIESYDISSRQTGSISDSGIIGIINYITRIFCNFYVFYAFILTINHGSLLNRTKKNSLFLMFFGYLMTISGSYDAYYILLIAIMLFAPVVIRKIFLGEIGLSYWLIGVVMILAAALIGVANKIGVERLGELINPEYMDFYIDFFVERYIINSVIFMIATSKYLFDVGFQVDLIVDYIDPLVSKISYLFNAAGSAGDIIYGVNRIAYFDVFKAANDLTRTGASPGLFGSISYFPFFPLNILFFALYAAFIFSKLNSVIYAKIERISVFGVLLLIPFIGHFFESPINFLKLTDAGLIYFLMFLFVKFQK